MESRAQQHRHDSNLDAIDEASVEKGAEPPNSQMSFPL
jgi:hypothetical protein